MKAISIHQPWAHAILHLGKNVENRSRPTHHRGALLIHASQTLATLEAQSARYWKDRFGVELPARDALAFGAIVGLVDVVGCVQVGRVGIWVRSVSLDGLNRVTPRGCSKTPVRSLSRFPAADRRRSLKCQTN